MDVKYPNVCVRLSGIDGNAFNVIGKVAAALRQSVDGATASQFSADAYNCGSYDEVLRLAMSTVTVE